MDHNKKKSEVSSKKLEANRTNAQRSTGPKTPAGKAKAAQNSYKHGVFALRLFASAEQHVKDGPDYNSLYRGFYQHYSPEGYMENFWLEKITTEALRLARLLGFEQEAFGRMSAFLDRTLDKLMRYETAVTKHFRQAIEELESLQRKRKEQLAQAEVAEFESGSTDTEELAQASSSNTAETNPPDGPSEEELMATLDVGPSRTENYGTNPPQPQAVKQFTDDEPQIDDSEYDERNDSHPRQTAEDLLDGPDRIKKEH